MPGMAKLLRKSVRNVWHLFTQRIRVAPNADTNFPIRKRTIPQNTHPVKVLFPERYSSMNTPCRILISVFTQRSMPIPTRPKQCGSIIASALESINPSGSVRSIPAMQGRSLKSGGLNGLLMDTRFLQRHCRQSTWRTTASLPLR